MEMYTRGIALFATIVITGLDEKFCSPKAPHTDKAPPDKGHALHIRRPHRILHSCTNSTLESDITALINS